MSSPLVLAGFGEPIYVDRDLSFRDPINRQALAYWQSKSGASGMPSRAKLDPVEMRGFVANVALVEALAAGGAGPQPTFRIRLAGTAVEEVFGHLTGKLLAQLPDYFRPRWHNLFMAGVDARVPIRITTRVTLESKEHLTAEALLAPLSDDGSSVSMLFICVGFWSEARPPEGAR